MANLKPNKKLKMDSSYCTVLFSLEIAGAQKIIPAVANLTCSEV
jgi:hypothetical protein